MSEGHALPSLLACFTTHLFGSQHQVLIVCIQQGSLACGLHIPSVIYSHLQGITNLPVLLSVIAGQTVIAAERPLTACIVSTSNLCLLHSLYYALGSYTFAPWPSAGSAPYFTSCCLMALSAPLLPSCPILPLTLFTSVLYFLICNPRPPSSPPYPPASPPLN